MVSDRRRGLDRLAACAGILGGAAIGAGSVVTAAVYRGKHGQPYSPLNHFVSELGELAQSDLARVFNASLIVGGLCFAVFMSGFAASRPGGLRLLAGGVGVVAGVGGSFVGVFPMDFARHHGIAATTFFNLGWIAVGLASVDLMVNRDPRFPRWLAVVGAATVAAFIGFLREQAAYAVAIRNGADPEARPAVWALTALEWLTIIGIVGWVMLVGASWLRAGTSGESGVDLAATVSARSDSA
jgi:hypothetical membrane protein